jgi:hypothetical protein
MMRLIAGLLGALALGACTPPPPSQSVSLAMGEIIATSPSGYCVDGVASQPAQDFAMLAPCATLGAAGGVPEVVGVATVQVGPQASGQIAEDEIALRDYLITDAGAALLSQSGDADDINILSTQAFSDQVMVHFTDRGAPPVAGLQREEWRAFRNINGRLVTIAVRGLAIAPLQDGPGAGLLKLMLAGVQAAVVPAIADVAPDA